MRNIPDEFLGALFGAWIGVVTKIWNAPIWSIISFVGSLVIIALLLDVVAGPFRSYVRRTAGAILLSVALASGVVFTWAPGFVIFHDPKQVFFFWVLLAAWMVGILSTILSKRLPQETNRGES